jgi:hypothetical protein
MLRRPAKYCLEIDWSGLDAEFRFKWLADRQVTRAIVLSARLLLSDIGKQDKRLLNKLVYRIVYSVIIGDKW